MTLTLSQIKARGTELGIPLKDTDIGSLLDEFDAPKEEVVLRINHNENRKIYVPVPGFMTPVLDYLRQNRYATTPEDEEVQESPEWSELSRGHSYLRTPRVSRLQGVVPHDLISRIGIYFIKEVLEAKKIIAVGCKDPDFFGLVRLGDRERNAIYRGRNYTHTDVVAVGKSQIFGMFREPKYFPIRANFQPLSATTPVEKVA